MKRTTLIVLALVFAGWSFFSDFEAERFQVRTENNDPIVEWAAKSEEGLHHYEVHVRTQFTTSPRVETIAKRGAGHDYVFRDTKLYKALGEQVTYELYAAMNSGELVMVGSGSVDYTPTAVRRTWGSIKAMFQ